MYRSLLAVFLLAGVLAARATEPAAFLKISWQPQVLVNGTACLFTVVVRGAPQKVTAKWFKHDIEFSRGPSGTWYSLAGIAYETKPRTYNLELAAFMPDGRVAREVRPLVVRAARYKTSRLTVPEKYVTPDPETLKRIEAEKVIKAAAFAHQIPAPQWAGDFVAPVSTGMSDAYGTSRTLNGKLATVHRGEDFHAPMGTPVHASNSGEVVLARELFYEGNCVVIDHGLGFMTMYMHLSQFSVKEGDKVEKDQVIALSGDTGRATGPHLHMAVRWSGEYLDPAKLLVLKLPEHP